MKMYQKFTISQIKQSLKTAKTFREVEPHFGAIEALKSELPDNIEVLNLEKSLRRKISQLKQSKS